MEKENFFNFKQQNKWDVGFPCSPRFFLAIVFLALLFICSIANAQEKSDTIIILKEANIISTYRATAKTPVTQKTLSISEIRASSYGQEVPIFLTQTPSVTSYSDGGQPMGYTYFRLRGIDQTRINMTLNGMPLNEPEDQGCYFNNYPDLLSSVQSIQVQRGVGTTSGGVASYAGSINFESINMNDSAFCNTTLGMGSFNTYRVNTEISTGLMPNKISVYSRASQIKSDGYKYHSGNSGTSYFISGGYFGKNDIVKVTAFSGQAINNMAWMAAPKDSIIKDSRYNANASDEWDNFKQSLVQIQYITKMNNKESFIASLYYISLEGWWDLRIDTTTLLDFKLKSGFGGVMLSYKYESNKTRFTAGIHNYQYQRKHACQLKNVDGDFYNNTGNKGEVSPYFKFEQDVKKFTLFVDAQYRYIMFSYLGVVDTPDQIWAFTNPKAGITYTINKIYKVYASVGRMYREPTRTDMFGGLDNLDSIQQLKYVHPEEVVDIECGTYIKYKNLSIQANIFDMQFKNEITLLGTLGYNGLLQMGNVKSSYRRGVEFDLSYKYKKLTIGNNFSYMNSKITTDSSIITPLLSPNFIINQTLSYDINKKVSIVLGGGYISRSYIDLENKYTLPENIDVDVALIIKMNNHDLSINLNNITSTSKNISYTNGVMLAPDCPGYYVQMPRNLFVTLHLKF